MIKEMQGWKVLSSSRFSANAPIICDDERRLTYPVNEMVSPKIEDSKLFFFKNKEDAIWFTEIHRSFFMILVPCIAYNCSKAKSMAHCTDVSDIQRFWELKNKKKRTNSTNIPTGTWFADRIKCLA